MILNSSPIYLCRVNVSVCWTRGFVRNSIFKILLTFGAFLGVTLVDLLNGNLDPLLLNEYFLVGHDGIVVETGEDVWDRVDENLS